MPGAVRWKRLKNKTKHHDPYRQTTCAHREVKHTNNHLYR